MNSTDWGKLAFVEVVIVAAVVWYVWMLWRYNKRAAQRSDLLDTETAETSPDPLISQGFAQILPMISVDQSGISADQSVNPAIRSGISADQSIVPNVPFVDSALDDTYHERIHNAMQKKDKAAQVAEVRMVMAALIAAEFDEIPQSWIGQELLKGSPAPLNKHAQVAKQIASQRLARTQASKA